MKRRLPVLPTQASADTDPWRPGWHWILIAGGFVFTLWMPLALLAQWLARTIGRISGGVAGAPSLLTLFLLLLSLALASLAAGALVGRFGQGARPRHAALGALAAVSAAWLLALVAGALAPLAVAIASLLVLGVTSAPAAWLAFKLGVPPDRRSSARSGATGGVDRPRTRH